MNRVEAIITLTNTAFLLRDGTRYMKPEHEKQFREAYEMAIKALEQEQPEIKPIEYRDCANAMLRMWMDNVITDGEYNRIMDKLNAHWWDEE